MPKYVIPKDLKHVVTAAQRPPSDKDAAVFCDEDPVALMLW